MTGHEGLCEFVRKSHRLYREEVMTGKKVYDNYVRDFLSGHFFHDATDAISKNSHLVNFNRMKDLLESRRDLVKTVFELSELDENMIEALIVAFNTMSDLESSTTPPPDAEYDYGDDLLQIPSDTSFEHCLTPDSLNLIARCANEVKLFKETLTFDDVRDLFSDTPRRIFNCNNTRLLAFLFNELLKRNLITSNWKIVIERRGNILRHSGDGQPVSSNVLRVSLNHVLTHEYNSKMKKILVMLSQL